MTAAYLDASVLTRIILNEPSVLAEWNSLDAIHLATAIAYRRTQSHDERPILFATHDASSPKLPQPCTSM